MNFFTEIYKFLDDPILINNKKYHIDGGPKYQSFDGGFAHYGIFQWYAKLALCAWYLQTYKIF